MSTIASLAIQLTLSPAKFLSGLGEVEAGLNKLAKLLERIPVVGGLLGLPIRLFNELTGSIRGQIAEVAELWRVSQKLGLSMDTLQGIAALTGQDVEHMTRAMFHFTDALGAANAGAKEAVERFAKLGLNAAEFKGVGVDEAFFKVADAVARLPQGMKGHALAELFGHKGGMEIMLAMAEGAGKLKDKIEQLRGMGLLITPEEAARMVAASRAMKDLDRIVAGIKRQFAVEFAPILGEIAGIFTDLLAKNGGLKGLWHSMAEEAKKALAWTLEGLADLIDELAKVGAQLQGILDSLDRLKGSPRSLVESAATGDIGARMRASVERAIAEARARGADIPEAPAAGARPGDFLRERAARLRDRGGPGLGGLAAAITVGMAGGPGLDEGAFELSKKVGELALKLQAERDAFGEAAGAAERWRLAQEGATNEELKAVDAHLKALAAMKKLTESQAPALNIFDQFAIRVDRAREALRGGAISGNDFIKIFLKLKEELQKTAEGKAGELLQQTATPLEKFKAHAAELQELQARGLITDLIAQRALAAGAGELMGHLREAGHHAPAFATMGSQEAFGAIGRAELKGMGTDPVNALKELQRAQLEVEKEQLQAAKDILDAIKKGQIKVGQL